MPRTFLDLVNEILPEIDEDIIDGTELVTPTKSETRRIKNYINIAYREIYTKRPRWSWSTINGTFNTVAGQNTYTVGAELPASIDMQSINFVRLDGYSPLRMLTYEDFMRQFGYTPYGIFENQQPDVAYVKDNALVLYPTPASVTTVTYSAKKFYEALSLADDEPLIPEMHRDVLYWRALAMAKNKENEASDEYSLYLVALKGLINSENKNHEGYSIKPPEAIVDATLQTINPLYEDQL